MGEILLEYQLSRKGRLPACIINSFFMDDLWRTLSQQGDFIWTAVIGSGGDLLGKVAERPQFAVQDWRQLVETLSSQTFDYLQITVEYENKGTLSLVFRNYNPAGGYLMVAGLEQIWVDTVFEAIQALFIPVADNFATRLYNRYGSFMIHSVIPLVLSFVIVIGAAVLFIPGDIRRSEYIWWITAGTVVANLKLGQIISDRIVIYILVKYPYLRWQR